MMGDKRPGKVELRCHGEAGWHRLGAGVELPELQVEWLDRAALEEHSQASVDLPGQPGETEEQSTVNRYYYYYKHF